MKKRRFPEDRDVAPDSRGRFDFDGNLLDIYAGNEGVKVHKWHHYLGNEAVLYGININPKCAQYGVQLGMVHIGSQDDPKFLEQVVEEMGGVDVVLDDGSHQMAHIEKPFACCSH